MSTHPVVQIIETLGDDAITARLGVTERAVRSAKSHRLFPALWFDQIDRMCMDAGIPCPRAAFNWRTAGKKSVIACSTANALTRAQSPVAEKAHAKGEQGETA